MAGRSLAMYMTPAEFIECANEAIAKFNVVALRDKTWEPIFNFDFTQFTHSTNYFILPQDSPHAGGAISIPAKIGATRFLLPVVRGNTMMRAIVDIRTDWYENGTVFDNNSGLALYSRIQRLFCRRLIGWCKQVNAETNETILERSSRYSKGAKDWTQHGGRLSTTVEGIMHDVPN
jgi:hypothetical protein